MLQGIDDPDRLRRFFTAKDHRNLVIRVADALGLPGDDQELLLQLLDRTGQTAPDHPDLRGRIQRAGTTKGYILIPIDQICRLPLEELQAVQALVYSYREIREDKGEPSVPEPCDCTNKGSRPADPSCRVCQGEGTLYILQEITDEERALAEGERHGR